jgi:hypothetical protein
MLDSMELAFIACASVESFNLQALAGGAIVNVSSAAALRGGGHLRGH